MVFVFCVCIGIGSYDFLYVSAHASPCSQHLSPLPRSTRQFVLSLLITLAFSCRRGGAQTSALFDDKCSVQLLPPTQAFNGFSPIINLSPFLVRISAPSLSSHCLHLARLPAKWWEIPPRRSQNVITPIGMDELSPFLRDYVRESGQTSFGMASRSRS